MYVWLPHWQHKMPSRVASCLRAVHFVHPCFRRYTGELVKSNVSLEKGEALIDTCVTFTLRL